MNSQKHATFQLGFHSFQTAIMPVIKFVHFTFLILLISFISTSSSSPDKENSNSLNNKCCNNTQNLIVGTQCVDSNGAGSKLTLDCASFYSLDPEEYEEDEFNILPNGTLHLHRSNEFVLFGT